jgi:hypothetical protein
MSDFILDFRMLETYSTGVPDYEIFNINEALLIKTY